MGLMDSVRSLIGPRRSNAAALRSLSYSLDQWMSLFTYQGSHYGVPMFSQTIVGNREEIDETFAGLVAQTYRANGVVWAVEAVRVALFSEARFQFRELRQGRPGKLFGGTDGRSPGNRSLSLLANPWPGATTADLLGRALLHADFAGTAFVVRRPDRLRLMRPDWVTVVIGSPNSDSDFDATDIDAEILGYIYHPGGRGSGRKPITLLADVVAPFAPMPDPTAIVRGVPWMTPVLREIAGDSAMTSHKIKYFENGATPNLAVSIDAGVGLEEARQWIELFKQDHEGVANAYKTLFLGGGSKPVPVGSDLQQIDFKSVQGAAETRIAAAGGVPPVIVGLSEGLASATYSNYGQARRRLADGTLRPLWRNFAGTLAQIVDVPDGAELWYDDRDIPFLQEDVKDAADIQSVQASSINKMITSGFDPDAVLDAIIADDWARLRGNHSGLYSVQLQPPGTEIIRQLPSGEPERSLPLLESGADIEVRCTNCGRLVAKRSSAGPAGVEVKCHRCGTLAVA